MTQLVKVQKYKAVRENGKFKILKITTVKPLIVIESVVKEEVIIPMSNYCPTCHRYMD